MNSRSPQRVLLNCDIGERGTDNPIDRELMDVIDIANIACGGHAGDRRSAAAFRTRAEERGVMVSAHLSYPDRDTFGRKSLKIAIPDLLASLEAQFALLPGLLTVKFHGALYTDSCRDADLAQSLATWLAGKNCTAVLTLPDSALAIASRAVGIEVLAEAFAERRYQVGPNGDGATLVGRDRPYASIEDVESAMAQADEIVRHGRVAAIVGDELTTIRHVPLKADTICVHSDSGIALPLTRELARMLRSAGPLGPLGPLGTARR